MYLSDDDLRDLAAFFARRVTPDLQPVDASVAPSPGRTPKQVWLCVLREAQSRRELGAVVGAVRRACPGDSALSEACELVTGEPTHWESVTAGGMLLAAMAGMVVVMGTGLFGLGVLAALETPMMAAVLGWEEAVAPSRFVTTNSVSSERLAPGQSSSEPTKDRAIRLGGSPPPRVAATGAAGDDRSAAAASMGPPDTPISGAWTQVPRAEDGPPEGPLGQPARCPAPVGVRVGWYYAGTEPPGGVGEWTEVPHSVHVRSAYPSRHNGWNKHASILCYLQPGDEVWLAEPAVELNGGHWWVPVHSGAVRAGSGVVEVAVRG